MEGKEIGLYMPPPEMFQQAAPVNWMKGKDLLRE